MCTQRDTKSGKSVPGPEKGIKGLFPLFIDIVESSHQKNRISNNFIHPKN